MEIFNLGFWLTIPIFLLIGSIPALIGGAITYFINSNVDENKRVEYAEKVTLVLLVLFSCGICNFWWSQ